MFIYTLDHTLNEFVFKNIEVVHILRISYHKITVAEIMALSCKNLIH